jgi:hypothetical protein
MNGESETEPAQNVEPDGRPSWSYPTILVLYVVILLLTPTIGTTIGLVLFLGLLGFCLWGAVSRRQYETLQKHYPSLLRSEYVLNMTVFPVVLPVIVFVLLVVFKKLQS